MEDDNYNLTDEDIEAILLGGLFLFGIVLVVAGFAALLGFWYTIVMFGIGILYLTITLSQ